MSLFIFDLPSRILVILFAFVLGTVSASFFTCMGGRIAQHRDWVTERSVCDTCGHVLGPKDLIPVVSYLSTRGRCRYCGAAIPPLCLITELCLGVFYAVSVMRFGFSLETLRCMVLSGLLTGLSAVDLAVYEIPNGFILAGILLWAVTLPFSAISVLSALSDGLLGGFLIGGGILCIALVFERIIGKESLGGGDIKLFFMTGLFLGPYCGLFNLILSCLFGLLFVILLRKSKIPFGPAISIATCVSLLWGTQIVSWYFRLFL